MRRGRHVGSLAAIMLGISVARAMAFSVTNNQNLTANPGNRLYGAAEEIVPSGSGTWASPWAYSWSGVSAGLYGSNVTVFTTGAEDSFVLDLGGGPVNAPGMTLSTEGAAQGFARGGIALRNVGPIVLNRISTRTYPAVGGYWPNDKSGSILIGEASSPAGPVTVGDLWTECFVQRAIPGAVEIHSSGDVRVRRFVVERGFATVIH